MTEYIEKTAVESGIFVAIIDKANNEQTIKEIIDDLPTADVIERAKVLDRIKQSKDEIKAYYEYATDERQKVAFNACLIVLDKLIAEVEG